MLVADDDPALRLLCRVNLEHEGFEVGEAENAEEVESAMRDNDVALVLLDIHLGADDGLEVARSLKAKEAATRVALFSGSAQDLGAYVPGLADAIIKKPFSLESMLATVRSLASRQR